MDRHRAGAGGQHGAQRRARLPAECLRRDQTHQRQSVSTAAAPEGEGRLERQKGGDVQVEGVEGRRTLDESRCIKEDGN